MGNMAEDEAWPAGPTCYECGSALERSGDSWSCTKTPPCLAQVMEEERSASRGAGVLAPEGPASKAIKPKRRMVVSKVPGKPIKL